MNLGRDKSKYFKAFARNSVKPMLMSSLSILRQANLLKSKGKIKL